MCGAGQSLLPPQWQRSLPQARLAPDSHIELTAKIAADLNQFLDGVAADGTYDPKSIQLEPAVGHS